MDLDEHSFAFIGFYTGVKERMVREDTCMLSYGGSILYSPLPKPFSHKLPNCFDSGRLFMKVQLPVLYTILIWVRTPKVS